MRFTVTGTVQGVGFRPTVYRLATELGLRGTVRNNGANVVIDVNADAGFIDLLKTRLPALAHIESCDIEDIPISKGLNGFSIIESDDGGHGIGTHKRGNTGGQIHRGIGRQCSQLQF